MADLSRGLHCHVIPWPASRPPCPSRPSQLWPGGREAARWGRGGGPCCSTQSLKEQWQSPLGTRELACAGVHGHMHVHTQSQDFLPPSQVTQQVPRHPGQKVKPGPGAMAELLSMWSLAAGGQGSWGPVTVLTSTPTAGGSRGPEAVPLGKGEGGRARSPCGDRGLCCPA